MAEAHAEHAHHIVSDKVLIKTYTTLFTLMFLTIAAAEIPMYGPKFLPGLAWFFNGWLAIWPLTNAIAIGIAVAKTWFVIQNFMGVRWASSLVRIWAIAGFVGFGLMFIAFFDYAGRPWEPVRGWENTPSTSFPRDRDTDAGVPYQKYLGNEGGGAEGRGE
jgi:caa(3)-type oxidase subunit IV